MPILWLTPWPFVDCCAWWILTAVMVPRYLHVWKLNNQSIGPLDRSVGSFDRYRQGLRACLMIMYSTHTHPGIWQEASSIMCNYSHSYWQLICLILCLSIDNCILQCWWQFCQWAKGWSSKSICSRLKTNIFTLNLIILLRSHFSSSPPLH